VHSSFVEVPSVQVSPLVAVLELSEPPVVATWWTWASCRRARRGNSAKERRPVRPRYSGRRRHAP
jgi:hypothetical protein